MSNYDLYETKALAPTRMPIPPMTSEELGKLEEKLIERREYYRQRADEALTMSRTGFGELWSEVNTQFISKARGIQEAIDTLRGR